MSPPMHGPDGGGDGRPEVVVGVVASPGSAWELATPPTDLAELASAGRRRLLASGWNLAVVVTDLPIETSRRPVVAHASATHGVAVLSMPALGAVAVRRRAAETIVRLVAALLGDIDRLDVDNAGAVGRARPPAAVIRRLRELGDKVEAQDHGIRMVARVVAGNVRLLLGMLRANRPWRLSVRLTRASVAALGAAVLALVTSDIWRLADSLGPFRLSLITVASTLATALTLVLGADLWERSPRPEAREQVVMFNIVTVTTVVIGVVALYLALFALTWLGVLFLVPRDLLAGALGHPVDLGDQLELAWLASSIATVGEALGAGLESDEAVREAAYTYHADEQLPAQD